VDMPYIDYQQLRGNSKESRHTGEVCGHCGDALKGREAYRVSVYGAPFVMMCRECAPHWLVSGVGKPVRYIPEVDVYTWGCAGCGRPVTFGMSSGQFRKRVYCSDQCRWTWRRADKTTLHEKVCEGCGETFESKRSDARTCSDRCRQRVYRRGVKGADVA
jgi:hypothetical protein